MSHAHTIVALLPTFCYNFVCTFTTPLYNVQWHRRMPVRLAWCHLCFCSFP
ncbi:hypothetical protein EXN66_Car004558 [Channa argus]|uniref:Uncharacterized protein n=1 Tax=Channa argus TaxID=215402 RepID=A0A6G1PFT1_CHAAH|nr:hypothetical protein EXN66_Car004558 [Channa argus]